MEVDFLKLIDKYIVSDKITERIGISKPLLVLSGNVPEQSAGVLRPPLSS